MRNLILILASMLLCCSVSAQELTKEQRKEMRIQKRMAALREQHIKDSLFWAEIHKADSIRHVERKKEGVTDIVATTSLSLAKAIDHVARSLIAADYVVSVDKEYNTITTQQISDGNANYSLYFRFREINGMTEVKACGFVYKNVGVAMYGIVSTNTHTLKVENSGVIGSTFHNVFKAYENILLSLPEAQFQYIKEEKK